MRRPPVLMALLALLLLSGCGGLAGEPEIVATIAPQALLPPATPALNAWRPDIKNGEGIFSARCVECHGESGDGRGQLVLAGSVPQPLDMRERGQVSPLEWHEIITDGRIENLMPPWEAALSETERWDVALYAFTLGYSESLLARGEALWRERCGECALPTVIPPVYTDEEYGIQLNQERFGAALDEADAAAAVAYARLQSLKRLQPAQDQADRRRLTGRVEHGTAGLEVPADTVVQLRYGSSENGYQLRETSLDASQRFTFEDLPAASEIIVGAVYGERLFSRRLTAEELARPIFSPTITIYATTHDPTVITLVEIELAIEALRLEDLGAGLLVSQRLRYRNDTDRVYSSGRGFDDGREASLLLQMPSGARLLSGDAGGRYIVVEGLERLPDSVIDSFPVLPGEAHQVALQYFLPDAGETKYEQAFANLVDARVLARLSEGLRLESDWLLAQGDGVYGGDLRLSGAGKLRFTIRGAPFATSSDDPGLITSDALPLVLLGAALLGAAGLAGLSRWRRNTESSAIDQAAAELARLEAEHDRGLINHDLYHQRRRDLRAKLADLMEGGE